MAKIIPKSFYRVRNLATIKTVNVQVRVSRVESGRGLRYIPGKAFVACTNFKTGGGKTYPKLRDACAYGKNPRQAIARALGAAKRKIEARSGAFAGYRQKCGRR